MEHIGVSPPFYMLELVLGFFVCLTATLRGFLVVCVHQPEGGTCSALLLPHVVEVRI